jgi:hypothetical protein
VYLRVMLSRTISGRERKTAPVKKWNAAVSQQLRNSVALTRYLAAFKINRKIFKAVSSLILKGILELFQALG